MRILFLLFTMALVVGCAGAQSRPAEEATPPPPDEAGQPPPPAEPEAQPGLSAPTPEQIEAVKGRERIPVRIETDKGLIQLDLEGPAAPIAVANFINLVKAGFYTDVPFHRVEKGFVIQAGDPAQMQRPPVGYTIADEHSPIKHLKGVIAMARLYRAGQMIPNSASTQFYITLEKTPHLDQIGFTAFGKVVAGMDVVEKIAIGDKILKATVIDQPPAAE